MAETNTDGSALLGEDSSLRGEKLGRTLACEGLLRTGFGRKVSGDFVQRVRSELESTPHHPRQGPLRARRRISAGPRARSWGVPFMAASAAAILLGLGYALYTTRSEPRQRVLALEIIQGRGEVARSGGERGAVGAGALKLAPDDVLTSSSKSPIVAALSDRILVQLRRGASARFDEGRGIKTVTLCGGELYCEVTEWSGRRIFSVETRHASVSVLGTRFTVRLEESRTTLEVAEGRVRLTRRADGASIEVGSGQYALVARGVELVAKETARPQRLAEPGLGPNLVVNPGFEEGIEPWRLEGAPAKGLAGAVGTPARSGGKSFSMNVSGRGYELWQNVVITGGETYRVSGWIETREIDSAASIDVWWLTTPDSTGRSIRHDVIGTLSGTQDWRFFSRRIVAPARARSANIGVVLKEEADDSGTAWFDDLYLGKVKEPD